MKRPGYISKSMNATNQSPQVSAAPSNKSLQVTFDPPRTFAFAKARVASNAPELRRYA